MSGDKERNRGGGDDPKRRKKMMVNGPDEIATGGGGGARTGKSNGSGGSEGTKFRYVKGRTASRMVKKYAALVYSLSPGIEAEGDRHNSKIRDTSPELVGDLR
ncbi:hypothetical protein Bca52824_028753 [Brassica carinata]|uniref:Uncharacterized protein n=1 Tax=Brassica carinata TaxID=52824 RepID=A0A8X7VCS5_BRACI|nr:hypothetical protein Bca52824_028753 [Brassica carinata]